MAFTNSVNMSLSKLWGIVKDREAWCATVHGAAKKKNKNRNNLATEQQQEDRLLKEKQI